MQRSVPVRADVRGQLRFLWVAAQTGQRTGGHRTWVETTLMLPIALLFLFWQSLRRSAACYAGSPTRHGRSCQRRTPSIFCRRNVALAAATLGFVQYLAPSCALMLAIFLYDEAVPEIRWVTFGFIWSALVIFSAENFFQCENNADLCREA